MGFKHVIMITAQITDCRLFYVVCLPTRNVYFVTISLTSMDKHVMVGFFFQCTQKKKKIGVAPSLRTPRIKALKLKR